MKNKKFKLFLSGMCMLFVTSCASSETKKGLSFYDDSFKTNMKDVASVRSRISISDSDILVYEELRNVYVTSRNETDCAGDITTTISELSDTFELEETIETTSFAAVSIDTLFNVDLNKITEYSLEDNVISASLTKADYKNVFKVDLDCKDNVDVMFTSVEDRIKGFSSTYKTTTNKEVTIDVDYYYVHNTSTGSYTVTFSLEGGKCKESTKDLKYVYDTQNVHILDPNDETFGSSNVTYPGFNLEGWYLTKIVNDDGTVTYKDKWDFETMRLVEDITLYAKWTPIVYHYYELFFVDKDNNEVSAGKYSVNEGAHFSDTFKYVSKITGYTGLPGFYSDRDCKVAWNDNFKHPGGETDTTIKVYFKVIEGEYAMVSTAEELKAAAIANKNIYLKNDIDFDEEFNDKEKKKSLIFDNYTGIFLGNNHTISNCNIVAQKSTGKASLNNDDAKVNLNDNELTDSMYYALFKSLDGATIKDVTFTGVKMNFYASTPDKITTIFAANLAVIAKDSTISNVNISASYTIDPRTKALWNVYYKNENFYNDLGGNKVTNVSINVVYEDQRGGSNA